MHLNPIKLPEKLSYNYRIRRQIIKLLEPIDRYWYKYITKRYYKIVPYDYRPHNIWYIIKCFCWNRYTTYKPRSLGHTWCDRDTVIEHMVFEILAKFIDQECSPGCVEWCGERGHKIIPGNNNLLFGKDRDNPESVYVLDHMKDLRNWFYNIYLKEIEETHEDWHTFMEKNCETFKEDGNGFCKDIFSYNSPENKIRAKEIFDICQEKQDKLEKNLEIKLIQVIKIREFMWT